MFLKDTIVLGGGFLAQCFKQQGFKIESDFRFENSCSNEEFIDRITYQYKYIINCIAKTDTKWCQENKKETYEVNVVLPQKLNDACKWEGSKLIQISTGCLYGQQPGQIKETANPRPVGFYAVSKYVADELLKDNALVIRPRLLYSDLVSHPKNLLNRILKFDKFTVEKNSMTHCEDIIKACSLLKDEVGIFNVSSMDTSMNELALNLDLEGEAISAAEIDKNLPDDLKGFYPNILLDTEKYRNAVRKLTEKV